METVPHTQAKGILTVDFFHVDTVLLRRLYVLFFVEHSRILRSPVRAQVLTEYLGHFNRHRPHRSLNRRPPDGTVFGTHTLDEYVTALVPFVEDGLVAGEPVAVAVPPDNAAVLRAELGQHADKVRWIDMTVAGRNPGWIIPGVLRAFADQHAFHGRRVTILCPYDARLLSADVLSDAEATHPILIDDAGELPSDHYAPDEVVVRYNT